MTDRASKILEELRQISMDNKTETDCEKKADQVKEYKELIEELNKIGSEEEIIESALIDPPTPCSARTSPKSPD